MIPATSSAPFNLAICERARLTRDARFDGLFFTAVKSTGIYCRPVCPAPTPHARNVAYYRARPLRRQQVSARACVAARGRAGLAIAPCTQRAGRRRAAVIEHGALDKDSLGALAARVGVGERHLRRLFAEELGASPLDVASTRRLLFAKQLLSETALPITDIAGTAGYASLRRFNAAFVASYGKPPREFRRARPAPAERDGIVLRLPYRPPYDFAAITAFHARRTIPGVEKVDASSYRRSIMIQGEPGSFSVSAIDGDDALALRAHGVRTSALGTLAARVRRMFDVDADPRAINGVLRRDALLKPLVRRWPGQRLPGAWDGFELAVRAVLGQQVSVTAARTLAVRLVERYGTPYADGAEAGIGTLFPMPMSLVDAGLEDIGLPRSRAATIRGLARACADGTIAFGVEQSVRDFVERLCVLPGIGAWTAHYIAMRALSQPDAFPAGDLVLRKIAGAGVPISERAMDAMAEAWRPWRAYAVMLLWRSAG